MNTYEPHLHNVTLNQDHRNLEKGLSIDLEPITLLVGDQGCGKSTLLELLQKNSEILNITLSKYAKDNGVRSYYFDTESMNPRINDLNTYSDIQGHSIGIGVGRALASKFMSHGEVLKSFTVDMISKAKNCVLLMDEPEAALSLKNQYKLAKGISKAIHSNTQLIIATHCLPIISSFKRVYDMENKIWINTTDYLKKFK